MATQRSHQNNFATNLTSNQIAGVTTTPLNSIPSVAAPFTIALDATNLNGKYEVVEVSSKTATNILHPATTYAHTTAEEVRMVVSATELDEFAAKSDVSNSGWVAYSTVTPTYTSADAPTFTITFASVDLTSTMGVGMRVKFTNNATTFYGIITAIAFSTNTVVTLYGGTDYTVANSAITAFYYSTMKAPLGFPQDPTKWELTKISTTSSTQGSPVNGTWYNLGTTDNQLTIPIGAWVVSYVCTVYGDRASGAVGVSSTLSTGNNTESDTHFTARIAGNAVTSLATSFFKQKPLVLASKTLFYLNFKTDQTGLTNIQVQGATVPTVIRAVCAYL